MFGRKRYADRTGARGTVSVIGRSRPPDNHSASRYRAVDLYAPTERWPECRSRRHYGFIVVTLSPPPHHADTTTHVNARGGKGGGMGVTGVIGEINFSNLHAPTSRLPRAGDSPTSTPPTAQMARLTRPSDDVDGRSFIIFPEDAKRLSVVQANEWITPVPVRNFQ